MGYLIRFSQIYVKFICFILSLCYFFFLVIQTDFQFSVELYVIQLSIQSEILCCYALALYVFPIGTYNLLLCL